MKAAVLGGTFDPVHYGHLYLAEETRSSLGYDTVLLVPTSIPAHKEASCLLPSVHRIAMLTIATRSYPQFIVDECEALRGGVSYTIDTIEYIRKRYDIDGRPGLVIGDDLCSTLSSWRNVDRLMDSVDLIVARRQHAGRVSISYPHRYLDNAMLPISSSDLRRRLRDGRAVRFLMPDEVISYVEEHGFYRSGT